jgi:hypothetical protein
MVRGNPKTAADERFEAYLVEHAVPYEYEPLWEERLGVRAEVKPDFLVDPDGVRVVAEVKQFETTHITDRLLRRPGAAMGLSDREVYGHLRAKMNDAARHQLLPFVDAGSPLVVVLANPLAADVHMDFDHVAFAILGNMKLRTTLGPDALPTGPAQLVADGYGAFLSVTEAGLVNHHPHISAVVVVHKGREMGAGSRRWVEVYDLCGNPTPPGFQGVPLPREVFSGPRDQWYGFTEDGFGELVD